MNEEKKIILDKINNLISKRTSNLFKKLPDVHEISDGVIIRFFTEWDNCADDTNIKFKKIVNHENPDDSVVFFYIPKGSFFNLEQRFYFGCLTCLNGLIEITSKGKTKIIESYNKICIDDDDIQGKAFENTYLITTSNRLDWSDKVKEYVKSITT